MGEYEVKDSGERAKFESGMVRDTATEKTDYELIFNGPMADRWAEHLTKGAKKYPDVSIGVPNWTLAAGQEERVRFRKSAVRHFRDWLRGKTDEDHAAAVFFNINGFEYVKSKDIPPKGSITGENLTVDIGGLKVDIKMREPRQRVQSEQDVKEKQEWSRGVTVPAPARGLWPIPPPSWVCPDCQVAFPDNPMMNRRPCGIPGVPR